MTMDKAFKGTVVNRALSYLHGESLEITLAVPLSLNIVFIVMWYRKDDSEKDNFTISKEFPQQI